jgi:regulator of protease activity HflC (stomatin/prohibitin superfamily)
MNTIGWIILVVLLVPALGILIWVIISASIMRIPSGRLGLLLVRGRPTDTVLGPGVHFVPAIRRRMVEIYPSVELSYRAGGAAEPVDQAFLDSWGPPVEAYLGDRAQAVIAYTVRFRLLPEHLRVVHERFGPGGITGVVRDEAASVVSVVLGGEEVSVDDLFGVAREALQQAVEDRLAEALAEDGIELMAFRIRAVDLGRAGEAIQTTARARHELAAEHATAATRAAQLDNDHDLAERATEDDGAPWRYRETELWRELVLRRETLNVTLPIGTQRQPADSGPPVPPPTDLPPGAGSP